MEDDSVIVVGAGTVGLVAALGLARAGIHVRVLETAQGAVLAPRDMVYHWSVLDGLDKLGVLPDCVAAGLKAPYWSYSVFETGERIRFDLSPIADEIAHPFNLHLGQSGMTSVLVDHLARHPNAVVEWGTEVIDIAQDATGVTVVAEAADEVRTYRAGWVVGADGARSVARRKLGLAFAGITWPQRLVATNLRYDFAQLGFDSAGCQLDETYGAVIAQVDGTGLWRYTHAESRTLPEESLLERVTEILAHVLPDGADPQIESAYAYRIHQRSADRFRVGRVMLVGDAAHLTNPAAGMGMTSGLWDAYTVTEALRAVIGHESGPDILDRYSDARHRNFREFCSPASSEAMELVFPSVAETLASRIDELRAVGDDPVALKSYLRAGYGCASASLLDGSPSPSGA